MAPQGILVDQGVMAKAAKDFDDTSVRIQDMMAKLNSEVDGLVGVTQNFNGSARLSFDQNKMLLNDRIQKARLELNTIAQSFTDVMTQHSEFSRQQGLKFTQAAQGAAGGSVVSGLNG
jgi:uncharacterized protein YukE